MQTPGEVFPDIQDILTQLDAAERDAVMLAADLTEEQGWWLISPDSWSVAQCLDHLASTNHVYLQAMTEAADRARGGGRPRRSPAKPGIVGRLFLKSIEPPVKPLFRIRAPRSIQPRPTPPLADALARLKLSQNEARAFLSVYADLDLAGIRFANPFMPGARFSLATGLHVISAHERRHLWQAWRVRRAALGEASHSIQDPSAA